MVHRSVVLVFFGLLVFGYASAETDAGAGQYLYAWTGDMDKAEGDKNFLATIDVDQDSATFGQVIATTPVNEVGTMPHHIEPTIFGCRTGLESYCTHGIYGRRRPDYDDANRHENRCASLG